VVAVAALLPHGEESAIKEEQALSSSCDPLRAMPSLPAPRPVDGPGAGDASNRLPPHPPVFIANEGQCDPAVNLYMEGPGTTLYFLDRRVHLALKGAEGAAPSRWSVEISFPGSGIPCKPVGLSPAETKVSFFKGEPEDWATGVSTFRTLIYPAIWPGVQLAFMVSDRISGS